MDEDDQEEYANKLLKIINMPYDVTEYRDKYDLASEREPIKRFRETRRSSVNYETDEMGRSYFDHYSGKYSISQTLQT